MFVQWCDFEAASCPRHKTLNEDNTLNLYVTPLLRKHFVWPVGLVRHYHTFLNFSLSIWFDVHRQFVTMVATIQILISTVSDRMILFSPKPKSNLFREKKPSNFPLLSFLCTHKSCFAWLL